MFTTFPGGWPAVALLLLRVAVGSTALVQGVNYFAAGGRRTVVLWITGVMAIAGGIFLLIGLLTAINSAVIAIGTIGMAIGWIPAPEANLVDRPLIVVLIAIVSAAVAVLGPGALSADARIFGRREIIIPPFRADPDVR